MSRTNFSSGVKWEDVVGYSRAVRVGNIVEVAGTTALNEQGELVGLGDPYEQAMFILKKIERALIELEAPLESVIRTRIYLTNINHWQEIGRAHGEMFRDIRPASTMVEVSGLISPDMLVEIEATALV